MYILKENFMLFLIKYLYVKMHHFYKWNNIKGDLL